MRSDIRAWLDDCERRGIDVTLQDGRIFLEPKQRVTARDVDFARAHRAALLAALEEGDEDVVDLVAEPVAVEPDPAADVIGESHVPDCLRVLGIKPRWTAADYAAARHNGRVIGRLDTFGVPSEVIDNGAGGRVRVFGEPSPTVYKRVRGVDLRDWEGRAERAGEDDD